MCNNQWIIDSWMCNNQSHERPIISFLLAFVSVLPQRSQHHLQCQCPFSLRDRMARDLRPWLGQGTRQAWVQTQPHHSWFCSHWHRVSHPWASASCSVRWPRSCKGHHWVLWQNRSMEGRLDRSVLETLTSRSR